jgi:hypothetical protein
MARRPRGTARRRLDNLDLRRVASCASPRDIAWASPACDHKGLGDRGGRAPWGVLGPECSRPGPGRDTGRVLVRSSGSGQYRRRTAGSGGSGLESGGGDAAPRGRQVRRGHGLRGARPGLLNGGSLAASARRRPSSIHCGINASSAPAIRHSSATACPLASYSGPLRSAEPSASRATSASRSGRSPATSRSSAAPAAFSSSSRAPSGPDAGRCRSAGPRSGGQSQVRGDLEASGQNRTREQ